MRNLVVLVVLNLVVKFVYSDLGDLCQTYEGINGTCSKIQDCNRALVDLKRNVPPTVCGFEGKESYVCCGAETSYRIGDISHQNCIEYNKNIRRNIVGGVRATSSEFAHMVALGYGNKNDIKWNCGGSLISERYVLTAAHCLYSNSDGEVKYVRAGSITIDPPEPTVQEFAITQVFPHPDYSPPKKYNDIALIKLDKPIKFSRNTHPACLELAPTSHTNLIAIGWGHLFNGGDLNNNLMKVHLVEYSNSRCKKVYSKDKLSVPNGIKGDLMICAGGDEDEEKDTCQGDSGGPLLSTQTTYRTIVGITSFGKICGTKNIPGVYTRVSSYIEWIENIVWG